ncbi:MAG: hypothetical protein M0Z59_09255 [Nitrospiraceae bacterium]|nr:hypothetical protein [Nitrospiraceae bacterium]
MTTKAKFHFDIRPEWEKAIRDGKKTVDARINITPYADVNKGDTIKYHSLHVRVKRINSYYGLNSLLQDEGFRKVVPGAGSIQEALDALVEEMHGIERPHGFLAFEIEPEEGGK